jgi:hypothetical protein
MIMVARSGDLVETRLASRDFGFRAGAQFRDENIAAYEQWHEDSAYLHHWRDGVIPYVAM